MHPLSGPPLIRMGTAGYVGPYTINVRVTVASPYRYGTDGMLAFAVCFAFVGVDLVSPNPAPYQTGHAGRFGQGDNISRDPTPTLLEPGPTSCISPVDIRGKPY